MSTITLETTLVHLVANRETDLVQWRVSYKHFLHVTPPGSSAMVLMLSNKPYRLVLTILIQHLDPHDVTLLLRVLLVDSTMYGKRTTIDRTLLYPKDNCINVYHTGTNMHKFGLKCWECKS